MRVVAVAALVGCWSNPRPASPVRDIAIGLPIEQLELANGMRVVVIPEPGVDEVAITMRLATGDADDPRGKPGLAHLVEHLSFEQIRDGEALFDHLEAKALAFNGITNVASTVFTERVHPADLGDMLDLEAARLERRCAQVPAASFARQREIMRNELRERVDDDQVWSALRGAVFGSGHPFAIPASTADDVATFSQEDVCSFASAHYGAGNAVLVVSGRVSVAELRPVLDRTVGRLPRSSSTPDVTAAAVPRNHVDLEVPVDRTWIVLAWPLSDRPAERARQRAVVALAAALVDSRVNGIVTKLELGQGSARQVAIAIAPSRDISAADALAGVRAMLTRTGEWYTSGVYEYSQSQAIYRFAAALDHGGNRDVEIADDVAVGRNARDVLTEELSALRTLGRDEASELVHTSIDPDRATMVTLRPARRSSMSASTLGAPVEEERRRRSEDPAAAHKDIAGPAVDDVLPGVQRRTLGNGLRVVLLPLATSATVDARLVIPAGSADEPRGQRGVASVAAHALAPAYDASYLRFLQAGGRVDREVDLDHTELAVRGLSSNVDLLLSGLVDTVREGSYGSDAIREVAASFSLAASSRDERVANDVWREAVFGHEHAYRHAGMWSKADHDATDLETLRRFRATHYVPDGSTLVIAGRFDVANANRWIDFYFNDWSGAAPARKGHEARLRALAFAQASDGDQITLDVALAAPSRDRASTLVLAEMLDEAIVDVREQLAASYGLHASVAEHRLSTTIVIRGKVDAARAAEAFALLRDRLRRLRGTDDANASLFVTARRHVVARLSSLDRRAEALADLFSHDIAVEAAPPTTELVERVRTLTIDRLAPELARVDLDNAAILIRGPRAALVAAYAAIDRKPTFVDAGER